MRATAGGADIPVGVTLLGPRPPAAVAREQLKPGVTLLGPPPQITWPRVIQRVSSGPTSIPSGLVPPPALSLSRPPARRAPGPIVSGPPAASRAEFQLAPLASPPMTAWTAFPGGFEWSPASAFPPADPEVPYPWNPVRWSDAAPFDRSWLPSSAWPPGVDAGDWSPVLWNSPPAWTDWQPRDAWDRFREPDQAGPDPEDAGAPLAPASPPGQD